MRRRTVFLILFLVLVSTGFAGTGTCGQPVTVSFSEFPPYKMLSNGKPAGIDVDILSQIAKKMDLKLTYKQGTFDQCLGMMERGEADLMTSLLRRPDREDFILYVQPRYFTRTEKVFYVLKGRDNKIRVYEDLSNLKIGVKAGVKYSLQFDSDQSLKKIAAQDIQANLERLEAGWIDTFIDTGTEGDYWINKLGYADKVTKAKLKFEQLDPIYLGLSRKSPLAKRSHEIGRALKSLLDEGMVQRFYDKHVRGK